MSKKLTFIETYENALPDYLCDWVIAIFDQKFSTTGIFGGMTTAGYNKDWKDSWEFSFDPYDYKTKLEMDSIEEITHHYIEEYIQKYAVHNGGREHEGKVYKVQNWAAKRYTTEEKQGYHIFHKDWNLDSNCIQRCIAVIYYLNDVEEGGETEFYYQEMKIKPKKGTLLIFPTHFTHVHKGNIPISNDKNILQTFYYMEPDIHE